LKPVLWLLQLKQVWIKKIPGLFEKGRGFIVAAND